MGSWGPGPFDNDGAADYLAELEVSPARTITHTLRGVLKRPAKDYLDVDDGSSVWAACELVALAFGQHDARELDDGILEIAGQVKPNDALRLLALEALPRIADAKLSEVAALWHEGEDGQKFDAALRSLGERLRAASAGPIALPKLKAGDVITLPDGERCFVVQVVGSGEVAVFEGVYTDDAKALAALKTQPAARVPTSVSKLLRRGRALGNLPVRKDLKGKKYYTGETGSLEDYVLATAGGGFVRLVKYDEARTHDLLRPYREDDLRAIAHGKRPTERVRSVDEREAELRKQHAKEWAKRREMTGPGPFGDRPFMEETLQWIDEYGLGIALRRLHNEATGATGYGRPNEHSERGPYALAGLVALWRRTWPKKHWPAELTLPPPPSKTALAQAVVDARKLASEVITRDAELRLIWDGASDGGAAFREIVASLENALEP